MGRRARFCVLGLLVLGACGPAPAPRIYGLDALDAPAPRSIEFAGAFENRKSEPYAPLARPSSAAVLPDGTLYFADYGAGRIHMFDESDLYQGVADSPATGGFGPLDLVARGFHLYVLDDENLQVLRYGRRGTLRDVLLDVQTIDPLESVRPSAMAVDRDGRVAICDRANHRVLVTTPFLQLETIVGEYGSFLGQMREPFGVAFGPSGALYVGDRGNRRVQVFDQTGQVVAATAGVDDLDPLMVAPSGMDCDRYGNLYVADPGLGVVHVLAPDLHPLMVVGDDEFAPDGLRRPVDCSVGPDDRLYVVDVGHMALYVYDIVLP